MFLNTRVKYGSQRQILHDLTSMWNLENNVQKLPADWWLPEVEQGGGRGQEMGKGGKRVQPSSCKVNNNSIWCISKLLKEQILKVLTICKPPPAPP